MELTSDSVYMSFVNHITLLICLFGNRDYLFIYLFKIHIDYQYTAKIVIRKKKINVDMFLLHYRFI